jgi:DNA-binding response OmpR family regulator
MPSERIMVIEDEPDARQALGRLLAEEGYTVCTAADGQAGLALLGDFRPDTVVCDFLLPDMSGLQVLRQMRASCGEGLTFIVVTGACGGHATERLLREEADLFLLKPVDLSLLWHALRDGAPVAIGGKN